MTVLTDAYVLRKSQRGDFDRQYALFTKDLGKISVLAKGAMKVTSKLAPHLDFFYLSEIMVAPGRNFYRLAGAKIKSVRFKNDNNQLKRQMACFFLEAVDILTAEISPDVEIFRLIDALFLALSAAANDRESHLVLNRSLYDLLARLGYRPKLSAQNQLQLTFDLHQQVLEAGEKEIKSFSCLKRELCSAY